MVVWCSTVIKPDYYCTSCFGSTDFLIVNLVVYVGLEGVQIRYLLSQSLGTVCIWKEWEKNAEILTPPLSEGGLRLTVFFNFCVHIQTVPSDCAYYYPHRGHHIDHIQVNHQLSPVWSTFLTISLKKQNTQLNSAHNMNNTSEVVTLSIIGLILVAPVNSLLLKWPKNKIYENSIITRCTLSSNISNFWPWMLCWIIIWVMHYP